MVPPVRLAMAQPRKLASLPLAIGSSFQPGRYKGEVCSADLRVDRLMVAFRPVSCDARIDEDACIGDHVISLVNLILQTLD